MFNTFIDYFEKSPLLFSIIDQEIEPQTINRAHLFSKIYCLGLFVNFDSYDKIYENAIGISISIGIGAAQNYAFLHSNMLEIKEEAERER